MGKLEIIHPNLHSVEQNVLDIYQFQIISMLEELAIEENVLEYLRLLNRNGFWLLFEPKEGKLRFTGCDPKYMGINTTIQEQFEWNVIFSVKQMLTDWHQKRTYPKEPRNYGDTTVQGIELTKKQRGVLTKILKIENKRKKQMRLLVR